MYDMNMYALNDPVGKQKERRRTLGLSRPNNI